MSRVYGCVLRVFHSHPVKTSTAKTSTKNRTAESLVCLEKRVRWRGSPPQCFRPHPRTAGGWGPGHALHNGCQAGRRRPRRVLGAEGCMDARRGGDRTLGSRRRGEVRQWLELESDSIQLNHREKEQKPSEYLAARNRSNADGKKLNEA